MVRKTRVTVAALAALCCTLALFNESIQGREIVSAQPHCSRTPSYTGEGAAACLKCHSRERMHAIAEGVHGNEANPSSPLSQQSCEACHGPGSIHVSRAHGGVGFPLLIQFGTGPGFSPRDIQIDACLSCHEDQYGHATLIGFRGGKHDRRNINCSTCHEIHSATDPSRITDIQAATCLRCHRKMREEHPPVGRRQPNFDRIRCARCHDIHPYRGDDPAVGEEEAS